MSALTPKQFVAKVVGIFNMPSAGRTSEQRQFLHACGSLYKKKLLHGTQESAANASITAAVKALDTEVERATGATLGPVDSMVESGEECSIDAYAPDLVDLIYENTESLGLTDEAKALEILLSLGEFKSINGEFGFELYELKGGSRKQRGGGAWSSLKKLTSSVCDLFKGGVRGVDDKIGSAIDSVSTKLSSPGFFDSIFSTEFLSTAGIFGVVFTGSGDPVIRLATTVVRQLTTTIDVTSSFANVFHFGTNVYSLMSALIGLSPKLICILFLWKVVKIIREVLAEYAKAAATMQLPAGPNAKNVKGVLNARFMEGVKKAGDNLPGIYEVILARVLAAMGRKSKVSQSNPALNKVNESTKEVLGALVAAPSSGTLPAVPSLTSSSSIKNSSTQTEVKVAELVAASGVNTDDDIAEALAGLRESGSGSASASASTNGLNSILMAAESLNRQSNLQNESSGSSGSSGSSSLLTSKTKANSPSTNLAVLAAAAAPTTGSTSKRKANLPLTNLEALAAAATSETKSKRGKSTKKGGAKKRRQTKRRR
jgi:hypothetical protein